MLTKKVSIEITNNITYTKKNNNINLFITVKKSGL